MKKHNILLTIVCLFTGFGCSDYLDIVPDGTATLEHAFADRERAEEFLVSCYRYLPDPTDCWTYPGYAGNEFVWSEIQTYDTKFDEQEMTLITKGRQKSNLPYLNFWGGGGGKNVINIFEGIRMCNIFFENIDKPYDLKGGEKAKWIAEVKFLKAYYHYFLLQLYGPIPLIKENLPVDAKPENVKIYREPFDECVDYIVELLDESIKYLPYTIGNELEEAGRITMPIALALKAKVLVLAASDLFNGNPDYAKVVDNRGKHLFSTEKSVEKWKRAAESIKAAIDTAEMKGNIRLYRGNTTVNEMPEQLKLMLKLRGTVTDKWNEEIIWGTTQLCEWDNKGNLKPSSSGFPWWNLARQCMPNLYSYDPQVYLSECGVPMHIAELFYTNKGIPMENDPDWIGKDRNALRTATEKEKYIIKKGEQTAQFNFDRETRFYSSLAFDASIFQMKVTEIPDKPYEPGHPYVQGLRGEIGGYSSFRGVNPTGYWAKKLVAYGTSGSYKNVAAYTPEYYSLPIIRLADLYLLYSEALNEIKAAPDDEVWKWIDAIRIRAGLNKVVDSWAQSNNSNKPFTQEGMREIIHRERMIELAFEGQMFFDLRRWKWDAYTYLNKPIMGWTINSDNKALYYKPNTIYSQRTFTLKDFLWPINDQNLIINTNLVQNPNW